MRKSLCAIFVACAVVVCATLADEPPLLKTVPDDFTIVDIRPFCNMGWTDETAGDGRGGWSDQGDNDMPNAPLGLRDCRGIPFDIVDATANEGKSLIVFKSRNFANGVDVVEIPLNGARAETIYVLQAAAFLKGGAAKFTLIYEDGGKSKTLQAWENIRVCNWWRPTDGSNYKVAFVAANAMCDAVGMVVMQWCNEQPAKPLKSLLIQSYRKETVMIVGGVTLSRKKGSPFKSDHQPAPMRTAGIKTDGQTHQFRYNNKFFYPPQTAHDGNRNWSQVQKRITYFKTWLKKPDAAAALARELLADEEPDEIYTRMQALAYLVEFEHLNKDKNKQKAGMALIARVFDNLQARNELRASIVASELLCKTVAAVGCAGGSIRDFPDELCERAAALLDHPDPVVQAAAEWTLAQRFKKNNMTSHFRGLFPEEKRATSWFQQWWNRGTDRLLDDDYARQLVHLDRHRTLNGLRTEVDKIATRLEAMAAAPDSRPDQAAAARTGFDKALTTIRAALDAENLLAAHQAYPPLRRAARHVIMACRFDFPAEGCAFMTNYRIPGGDWNVNMAVVSVMNMPCGDIHWKTSADPAYTSATFGVREKIGDGSLRGMDLDWDTAKIVFSLWNQPINPKFVPYGWNKTKNAHIYELDVASGAVCQLTKSPGNNDIEPCYLPNGDVIFASDRSSFGNQCAGPFIQDKRCTTLFRIDPKRSPDPVAISNNKDFDRYPHILNDGTVVFMHWEYQERDLYNSHTAWRCRPDGSNMDAFYKQHIAYPMSIRDVQQAPDSQICVATAQGHHDSHIGPVILFNPSLGINNPDTMQLVTPGVMSVEGGLGPLYQQVVPEGGVENRGGSYINPFPMSEKAFLVGHDMEGLGGYRRSGGMSEYAVYYIDVWGNRELIHRDKEMSCFMPHPLRKRKRPLVIADIIDPDATYATAFCENVYRDMPGVAKGAVKYLRMSQRLMLPAPVDYDDPAYRYNHLHWQPGDSTSMHFGYWTFAPTRTIGFVQVEEDGSAYFKVPAGTPVYLQALDENWCEIRRMRTSFTLQRGEFRGCVGCHESQLEAVGTMPVYPKNTMNKGPQTPVKSPWGDCAVQDFRRDIQPIFDKHCVGCHGVRNPEAELDLTGRPVAGFTQSYRSLFGIGPDDPQVVNDLTLHKHIHPEAVNDAYVDPMNKPPNRPRDLIKLMQQSKYPGQLIDISDKNARDASVTQPYQFGTNKSKLIRKLLDDPSHCKSRAAIAHADWLALTTWIDHNANFHSTLIDKSRYQKEKKVTRVPYYLPDPWIPADLNPSFYNKKNSSIVPDKMSKK